MPAENRGTFSTRGMPLRSKIETARGHYRHDAQVVVLRPFLVGLPLEDLEAHELEREDGEERQDEETEVEELVA